MDIKLFDSELKVMGVLWQEGDTTVPPISCLRHCWAEKSFLRNKSKS